MSSIQWFSANCGLYASKEEHLRLTGRHKNPPRAPTPPAMWKIGFPDSLVQDQERFVHKIQEKLVHLSCIVQLFQPMMALDTQVCNEFECPLYELTCVFQRIQPDCIINSVSFSHECTPSCQFKHTRTHKCVERQDIQVNMLVFAHDYSNKLYSFNIYCMHSTM